MPGKWLPTRLDDMWRDKVFLAMQQVAEKSGTAIRPVQSQHVTLWAAPAIQRTYLPDVRKLEKFFHTKCAEPIRSGLDKRSTHIVLLQNHNEYEAWCRTVFQLLGKEFRGERIILAQASIIAKRSLSCRLFMGGISVRFA